MKFDTPATTNPIDQLTIVGKPTERVDGKRKTTGTAMYSHEHRAYRGKPAYGFVVGAGIAKGRIAAIDDTAAKAAPGVLAIVTAHNAGTVRRGEFYTDLLLAGPVIDHYHQAVAIVVAETFEQARYAASLLRIEYVRAEGSFDLAATQATSPTSKPAAFGGAPVTRVGDFDAAFAAAPVKVDETYTTPDHTHAMMEPHATIAEWQGDEVTCWCPIQQLNWGVRDLAHILDIPKEKIHLVTPFIGGSFGGKGTVLIDTVAAVLAARATGRPVKVALTRALVANGTTHRPATIQRVRLGATRDGTITAIGHEAWSGNLPSSSSPERATTSTRLLYAAPNRMTHQHLSALDLPEGAAMRAPGESTGMMALEIAIDELAEKLGMDPVMLRVRNDTQVDPEKPGRPFSKRDLVRCLRVGSERFGWAARNAKPASVRDGGWLVGMGVASAIRGAPVMKSAARVRLDARGIVTVETDMTDIGTGSYTIVAQTAAEMMGIPIDRVDVRLGDSRFPESPGSGGQWGAASVTSGVFAACTKLREAVARKLGIPLEGMKLAGGDVIGGGRRVALASAASDGDVVAEDEMTYGDLAKKFAQDTFGAHFVEVGVDAVTGETRLRRMLAVCSAGRILNPTTARSQVIGAMTMGAGAALMEELVVDTRAGFFVNHDLASYEVPVHADIPHQDVVFLDEVDATISPLKAKGVGELGIVGVAAAVANAIYNATGVRVRDYPITLDKLLHGLPDVPG